MTPIRKMPPVFRRVSRVAGECLASGGLIDSLISEMLCYNISISEPRMPNERAGMSKRSKGHRRKRVLVMGGCIAALAIVPASAQTADPTPPLALPSVTHALDPLTVTARRIATVSSKITGKVDEVLIEEGQVVEAGEVMARLEATDAQAQQDLAQARLAAAASPGIGSLRNDSAWLADRIEHYILPALRAILAPGTRLVTLIKPQFELEKRFLNKHGVVKSASVYPDILKRIEKATLDSHFEVKGITDSPIIGGDGNKEFLMYAVKK
mgnify:CR=1 FL=1